MVMGMDSKKSYLRIRQTNCLTWDLFTHESSDIPKLISKLLSFFLQETYESECITL